MTASYRRGLFIGLVTLDLIYLAESPPTANQKIVAIATTMAAGGPATNAAVTFSYLGSQGVILGAVGQHPMAQSIRADVQNWGAILLDLTPDRTESPPVSSIIVTRSTGDRAVVSLNAKNTPVAANPELDVLLDGVEIVLIDGHQMEVGAAIAQRAANRGIPVVVDAGSWKPGFENVLLWTTYAICSENFLPPSCRSLEEVVLYLSQFGIPHVAVTGGGGAIAYLSKGDIGIIEVPRIHVVDTLGAGDILHGAFCHFIGDMDFVEALKSASQIASHACQFFGTRSWMEAQPYD
jgi:sugar/nucleoside kinase (ribokinase family)